MIMKPPAIRNAPGREVAFTRSCTTGAAMIAASIMPAVAMPNTTPFFFGNQSVSSVFGDTIFKLLEHAFATKAAMIKTAHEGDP